MSKSTRILRAVVVRLPVEPRRGRVGRWASHVMRRARTWVTAAAIAGIVGFLASQVALFTGAVDVIAYAACVLASLGLYAAALAIAHLDGGYSLLSGEWSSPGMQRT